MPLLATPEAVAPVLEADLRRREPRPAPQVLLGLVAFALAAAVGTGVIGTLVTVAVHGSPSGDLVRWYAAHSWPGTAVGLVVEGVLALALYPVLVRRLASRPVYELAVPGAARDLGAGIALGTTFMVLVVAVVWAFGGYHVVSVGWDTGILTGLAIGVGPGIAEEIAFRGVLLRILDKLLGSRTALVATSAVFGVAHLGNADATLWGAVAIAVEAGLLLGAAYLLTRRLWFGIGLHGAWNAVQSAVFGIDVSGSGTGRGLVESTLSGGTWLSGGAMGVEGSVVTVVLGLGLSAWLLTLAARRGMLRPARQRGGEEIDLSPVRHSGRDGADPVGA